MMDNLLPCADWADKLALKPADLSPADRAALQAHLATCPTCAQLWNDYQTLITRLRALPRPEPGPMPQFTLEVYDPRAEQQDAGALNGANGLHTRPDSAGGPIILLPPLARRKQRWQRRLSGLVAAVILLALVGTLALLFLQHRQSIGGGFQIRPGWQQIALYSGTGSKTITGQHLQLPRMWGSAFTCTGSGGVDLKETGPKFIGVGGTNDCQAIDHHPVAPAGFEFDMTPHAEIQTITIKADAHTRWYLMYLEKVPQPAFMLGPGWASWAGIGGTGKGEFVNGGVPPPYQTALWGALFVCIGSGTGTLQFAEVGKLDTAGPSVQTPPCDGQPRLITIHFAAPTALQEFFVNMSDNTQYYAEVLACTDESQCQATPAPITVTPTPTAPPHAPPGRVSIRIHP